MSADTPLIGNPIRQQFYEMMELHRDLSYETVRMGLAVEDQPLIYNYELLAELSLRQATLALFFADTDFGRVYPCDKVQVWDNLTDEIMGARSDFRPVLANLRKRLTLLWTICDENNWWDKTWGPRLIPTQTLKEKVPRPVQRTYDAQIPADKRLD